MSQEQPEFEHLAIIGVGLIGGSIALAARARGVSRRITGIGRNLERLNEARRRGIIDHTADTPAACKDADLVIVATPVDRIAADVKAVLACSSAQTLVTDAGSIKGVIARDVAEVPGSDRFVGSHPLAGSHHSGFEHASATLFENRLCVVTPAASSNAAAVAAIQGFWTRLGMRVREMSADLHDRTLALTSHLPHMAAAAVAAEVDADSLEYAATGYRDTTRVAAGDPDLWTAIFALNAQELVPATDSLIQRLTAFRDAVQRGDRAAIRELLAEARDQRLKFREPAGGSSESDG